MTPVPPPTQRDHHPSLNARQREILRARCEAGSRKAAAHRLGVSVWAVHKALERLRCCKDDAQACWEHRAELAEMSKT